LGNTLDDIDATLESKTGTSRVDRLDRWKPKEMPPFQAETRGTGDMAGRGGQGTFVSYALVVQTFLSRSGACGQAATALPVRFNPDATAGGDCGVDINVDCPRNSDKIVGS
jgi:hypothetical protein